MASGKKVKRPRRQSSSVDGGRKAPQQTSPRQLRSKRSRHTSPSEDDNARSEDEDSISNAGNHDQDDVIVLDTDEDDADDDVDIIEDDDDYLRPRQTRRAAGSNGEKQRFEDRYGDMKPGKVLSMLFVFPTVSRIKTYQTPCRSPANEVAFPRVQPLQPASNHSQERQDLSPLHVQTVSFLCTMFI